LHRVGGGLEKVTYDGRRFTIEVIAGSIGLVLMLMIVVKLSDYIQFGNLGAPIAFVIWALCYFAVRSVIMSFIGENPSQPECNGEGNSQRSDTK
jgi:hypothetical protein